MFLLPVVNDAIVKASSFILFLFIVVILHLIKPGSGRKIQALINMEEFATDQNSFDPETANWRQVMNLKVYSP